MHYGIKKLYLIAINVILVLTIGAYAFADRSKEPTELLLLEPDAIVKEENHVTEYAFQVMERNLSGQGAAFFSNHQNVKVYCDSVRIYELEQNDSIFGHTTGSVWNFIHIPYGTKVVRIRMEPVYDSYEMSSVSMYVGNDRELYCSILENSIFAMACSAIIVLIGIALISVWVIVRKKTSSVNQVFYLGVLAVIFGLWSFNETNGAVVLINQRIAQSFMAFVLLKLLSPTFALFVREYVGETRRTVWNWLSRIVIVDAVITISMQMLHIADLKETVITTHILLIVCILYGFVIMISYLKRRKALKNAKMHFLAAMIVIFSVTAGFIHYFVGGVSADIIGRLGFLIFAALSASETAKRALQMMEKGKYAAIYEELAITDSLTGLYNRNAYQIDTKKIVDLTGFMIVTFDLNDLKHCNDTKGHAQGDAYIITAAKMIEKLFGTYGRCYRIGGDEFCAILRNGATCPIESILVQLEVEQARYNTAVGNADYPIHIAAGYAIYDAQMDDDIEAMRARSDVYMYRNKRKLKEDGLL